ncbi:MAG: hypothetical protein JSV91_04715 [Phycisphaerales bacterium]|nr:MAG: hypothetical protein JSV91_04715 [Phycisphaerales bacterium]
MELRSATKADFSITLEDRPGALAALSLKMQEAGIELLGLWGYGGRAGTGKLYCVPKDARQFREFAQDEGLEVEEGLTIYLSGADRGGALVESLELIAQGGINVHAIQAISVHGEFGCFIWADAADWDTIAEMLS